MPSFYQACGLETGPPWLFPGQRRPIFAHPRTTLEYYLGKIGAPARLVMSKSADISQNDANRTRRLSLGQFYINLIFWSLGFDFVSRTSFKDPDEFHFFIVKGDGWEAISHEFLPRNPFVILTTVIR